MGVLDDVILLCREQDGYIEKASDQDLDSKTKNRGTANYQKYSRDVDAAGLMGCQAQPWCCTFQFWIDLTLFGKEKALKLWNMEKKYVGYNCFATYDAFKAVGKVGKEPKVGSLVIFTFSHAGRVLSIYERNGQKYIEVVEGNTSSNLEDRNGGQCKIRERGAYDANIKGYCYIDYDSLESDSDGASPKDNDLITYPIKTGKKRLTVTVEHTLNVRDYPVTGKIVGVLHRGNVVTPSEKTVAENGKTWFYLSDRKGWVAASYLTGWIQEEYGEWWWLDDGYTWPTNCVKEIDGALYYFGCDGYMAHNCIVQSADENTYFARSDGSLITNDWYEYAGSWYYCQNDGTVIKSSFLVDDDSELYYFNEDGTMFEGEIALASDKMGALKIKTKKRVK